MYSLLLPAFTIQNQLHRVLQDVTFWMFFPNNGGHSSPEKVTYKSYNLMSKQGHFEEAGKYTNP